MKLDPAVLDAMVASGCSAQQIAAAVKASILADHDAVAARREADRLRKRRQRENEAKSKAASDMSRGQSVTLQDAPDGSPSPSPEKESPPPAPPPKEKQTPSPTLFGEPSVLDVLLEVVDKKHALDLIAHRKGFRGKFTVRAAELLVAKFKAFGDPAAAIDAMISNNWMGFEPEWMERRNRDGNGSRNATRADHGGGDSRSERRMRAWLGDAKPDDGAGDGPTIDGHAVERARDR